MRACTLSLLILVFPGTIRAQVLDLVQHRFTDDVRVLTASEYLPRETFRALQQAPPEAMPGPVAVGALNGVTYFYRSSPSGLFATEPSADWQQMSGRNSWRVECARDAMDDSVVCRLTREDLVLVFADPGGVVVLVGRSHYPGSAVALRIDQEVRLRTAAPGFLGLQASEIVDQLLVAGSVTTRYQEWPYRSNVDKTIQLYGFKEALSFLHWLMGVVR